MKHNQYKISTYIWLYPGMAGWHFASVPPEVSDDIKNQFGYLKRGWGSLPVIAKIGETSWKTSIFPDKQSGGYLLPIKAQVRKKEKISADDKIVLFLEIKI